MRIALAQLNPIVGDIAGNTALIQLAVVQARRDRADVLLTSELALLGYPPRDLIQREDVVESCERAAQQIARDAGALWVIVGHPRRASHGTRPFANSVSVCHDGQVVATYDKQLLPGYDVFDEDRYFESGSQPCVLEIAGRRVGILICEDLWVARDVTTGRRYLTEPIKQLVDARCDLVLSPNASPFVLGKWQRHVAQLREIGEEFGLPIVAVNQVGANDDLIFDGRSIVTQADGSLQAILPGFESCVRTIEIGTTPTQSLQSDMLNWSDRNRELFSALVLGIRDYVHKTGHHHVALGLSGGIDSALTAVLAAAALGAENVRGITMPSRHSSAGSIEDSQEVAHRLGMKPCREVSIRELHQTFHRTLEPAVDSPLEGISDENVQSRLRGLLLMAVSNAEGSLVLATSNKSEIATGYSTLYGDMVGAICPLGDLTKTRIYQLAKWINANFETCGFSSPPIPESSISKVPSAELRPDQTDQDTLPPYDELDQVIERYIELEQSAEMIAAETSLDLNHVIRMAKMIDLAQYKRDQAPVILKVTGRTFGRGRPMPIVMKSSTSAFPQSADSEAAPDESAGLSANEDDAGRTHVKRQDIKTTRRQNV